MGQDGRKEARRPTAALGFVGLVGLGVVLLLGYAPIAADLIEPEVWAPALKASGIVALALAALWVRAWVAALGLLASAAGDAFLALTPTQLLAGMGAFGLAHVLYIVAFSLVGARRGFTFGATRLVASLALAAATVAMFFWLLPDIGAMLAPTAIYVAILTAMALTALQVRNAPLALAGALTFVASDAVLSARLFKDFGSEYGLLVWALYGLAQLLLAVGLARGLVDPLPTSLDADAPAAPQES